MDKVKDAVGDFVDRYAPQSSEEVVVSGDAGLEEVQSLHGQITQVTAGMPTPDLSQEQRDDLQGKRFPEINDLMYECAAGLRRFPAIAAEIKATPALFYKVAEQDMSIGGLIAGMQSLSRSAELGLLLSAERGDALCQQAEDQLGALLQNPAIDEGLRTSISYLFTSATQARRDAQEQTPQPVDVTEQAEALDQTKEQARKKGQVVAMARAVKEGRDALISPSLGGRPEGEEE